MFGIEELFERGMHYGHRKWRSSPKMSDYIFCEKWGIFVIDLSKTVPLFHAALEALKSCAARGGKILFVGTKHQAKELVLEAAQGCSQYYVNKRWLGGTLTNSYTIGMSIRKLAKIEKDEIAGEFMKLTKKERVSLLTKKEKMISLLGGIKKMGGVPDMLVVVDPKKEQTAINEAKSMNIPVIALADTDTPDPSVISYIVPGNDEGRNSVGFFLSKCMEAINEGIEKSQQKEKEVN